MLEKVDWQVCLTPPAEDTTRDAGCQQVYNNSERRAKMKRHAAMILTGIVLWIMPIELWAVDYAIVVSNSTYGEAGWHAVVDTLAARHDGEVFTYNSDIWEAQSGLTDASPRYICFVAKPLDASASFVQQVWQLTRALDDDIYGDAIWGIITGYNSHDAMRLARGPAGFDVKTIVGGTMSCDLDYYPQGIATDEGTYNHIRIKSLDGTVVDTVDADLCPTDRTEFLVNHINSDTVDMFVTSGHGNYNEWQLHYPNVGLEGFFRSSGGQVYGDPYSGPNIDINSVNPKIYFGLGNCYIGKIQNMDSMAPAWIHTGGASLYTGYVIAEGSYSHQHGGTKAYFARQAHYTWPEAFFLANQALVFDIENHTPGTNPPDRDGSALYGDPAIQARMSEEGVHEPLLYTQSIDISPGFPRDTITVSITMNKEGCPGYDGKWGNRHPAVLLPYRIRSPQVIDTNALQTVITENFVLMYVWYQGQPPLAQGEERHVTFTAVRDVDTLFVDVSGVTSDKAYINPAGDTLTVTVEWKYINTVNALPYDFEVAAGLGLAPDEWRTHKAVVRQGLDPGTYTEDFTFVTPPLPEGLTFQCAGLVRPQPPYQGYKDWMVGNDITVGFPSRARESSQ
jgi:hypothetical protein